MRIQIDFMSVCIFHFLHLPYNTSDLFMSLESFETKLKTFYRIGS